jgi:hypothetical protein
LTGIFPPVFQKERELRVIEDGDDRKVIAVYRPIGILTKHEGRDVRLWTGSFIALNLRPFNQIYIIPSTRSGIPLLMETWKLELFGDEIYNGVMALFGLANDTDTIYV